MTKQDKIDFIKDWYKFRENMCEKYNSACTKCPLYESSDGWFDYNEEYMFINNCKYDFEDAYVEEIIELMVNNKI